MKNHGQKNAHFEIVNRFLKDDEKTGVILVLSVVALLADFGELSGDAIKDFIRIFKSNFPWIEYLGVPNSKVPVLEESEKKEIERVLAERSKAIKRIWHRPHYTDRETYIDYIWSYVHMHVNRLSETPLDDEIKLYCTLINMENYGTPIS